MDGPVQSHFLPGGGGKGMTGLFTMSCFFMADEKMPEAKQCLPLQKLNCLPGWIPCARS
jgi:hypothetical protein